MSCLSLVLTTLPCWLAETYVFNTNSGQLTLDGSVIPLPTAPSAASSA